MSTTESPTPVDVEALKREIKAEVKEELRQDDEFREELKDELRDELLAERRPAPGQQCDGDVPQKPENVWLDGHPFGMWVDDIRTRVDELEETVEETEEQYECTAYNGVPEPDLTWMEAFYHNGRDAVDGRIRKRDLHAKILLKGLPDWAFETHNGAIVLPTAGKLKRKFERAIVDADDDRSSFSYVELYRACEALEERTDGKIRYIEDHPKIGRHLRIADADEVAINTEIIGGPPASKDSQSLLAAI